MLKKNSIILLAPFALVSTLALSGCSKNNGETRVLRILNAEDYIYEFDEEYDVEMQEEGSIAYTEDMLDQFIEYYADEFGEEVEIVYDTFDTNETMFNELETGKTTYDIIVPSDYMVQKLANRGMLHKLDHKEELYANISNYLGNVNAETEDELGTLDKIVLENGEKVSDYAVPYMWGTLGLMYNPNFYSDLEEDRVHELFSTWDSLYGEELANSFSIKDSVRDTYTVSIIHTFSDEVAATSTSDELGDIINRHDKDTISRVKEDMMSLKDNAFGFECDSGKTDMTTEKIGANICWSGDATWAITEAEDNDLELYYSLPIEDSGSNIWFDCFCLPNNGDDEKAQAQYDLAEEFINFMSMPINAAQNCYCVGYTPAVAGDEMLEYMLGEYDVRYELEEEEILNLVEGEDYFTYDLSYFFTDADEEDSILWAYPECVNRQLRAQYPAKEDLPRLAVMQDFGDEGNQALLDMWESVRTNPLPTWAICVFVIEGIALLGLIAYFVYRKVVRKQIKQRR